MKELLRLARLVLPLWKWAVLGILLSLATVLAHVGLLALSSWFIASMAITGSAGALMNYQTPAAGVRALALARAGGRYAERLVNHDTTFKILSSLRVWFYRRIEPLAPAGLDLHRSGDLLSRIRADIDVLDDFYVRGLVPGIVALLSIACIFPFLSRYDPRLALIDLASLLFAGILLPVLLRRPSVRAGRERVAWAAELRASLVEEIQGLAELETLGAADMHAARIVSAAREMDRRQRTMSSLQGLGEAGALAASALAAGAAAFLLVPLVGAGRLPRADMAMLTVFMLASFEAVLPLPSAIQRAGEMAAAARRLFEIIDADSGVAEPDVPVAFGSVNPAAVDADAASADAASAAATAVDISVRDLHFRYSDDQPWVLRGFSMDAPTGSRIGVAGPTGAGKSTLVSILLRFREYQAGSVRIRDAAAAGPVDVDLRSLGGEGARRLFSVVPQAPYLFHASIRENLVIANGDAGDEELWSALRSAGLSDLVASLPRGLDALVGETGRELSVGEAQRMAIARSLLRHAPVYIFDEPTEGLDDSTASAVLAAVEERLRGKTLIIISHRDRDLRCTDAVIRIGLEDAPVVEQGNV